MELQEPTNFLATPVEFITAHSTKPTQNGDIPKVCRLCESYSQPCNRNSKFPDIVIPEVPLFQYVLENTAKYGDKIAFIDYSSKFSLTYNQLAKLTFCVAKNLRKHYQFNKGDVLAIFLPNHPMYPVVFFGTQMVRSYFVIMWCGDEVM